MYPPGEFFRCALPRVPHSVLGAVCEGLGLLLALLRCCWFRRLPVEGRVVAAAGDVLTAKGLGPGPPRLVTEPGSTHDCCACPVAQRPAGRRREDC